MFWALVTLPAALAEIAGCFAFWAVIRLGYSRLWFIPGVACLLLFAWLLSFSPAEHAGRAYAFYGGIYILCSLFWGWCVEGAVPDRWDIIGAAICVIGAGLILLGPRVK